MQSDGLDRFLFWLGLPIAALWVVACVWYPLTDTDIWWHLASAKLMWVRKAFLRTDPFCQVSLGAPWTDVHWGFQLLAYSFWKLGGARALLIVKSLTLISTLLMIVLPHWNKRSGYLIIGLIAFGMYHARFFLDVRPLIGTLFILAAQYAILHLHFQGWIRRPWLLLIPLQILLVNIQALFPLGAFLVTCLFLEKAWLQYRQGQKPWYISKSLLATAAILWLAGLASPYGWHNFRVSLRLFERIIPASGNIFSEGIAENEPILTFISHHPFQAWPWVAFIGIVLGTFTGGRLRTGCGHLILFLAFTILGMMAVRNLPLVFLAGLMTVGANTAKEAGQNKPWLLQNRGLGLGAFLLILFYSGPTLVIAWAYELPGKSETPFRYPNLAVDYLATHPIPGNIFNELRYGGYFEFRLYPEKLSFIDGRMILRSADFYREFLDIVDHPEEFSKYQMRYGITHALLPIAEDRRFLPLSVYLLSTGGWKLVHCDGASALLAAPGVVDSLALPLDSLGLYHPISLELHKRFGSNLRLESMAWSNISDFLTASGKTRAGQDAKNSANP